MLAENVEVGDEMDELLLMPEIQTAQVVSSASRSEFLRHQLILDYLIFPSLCVLLSLASLPVQISISLLVPFLLLG